MFDDSLPDPEAVKGADDATLVTAIAGWARVEAAASARRLAAIAELVDRRVEGGSAERGRWSCDNWDAIAAEVGAAEGISHGMASGQMYLAVALRDRLPRVGALFMDGVINARLASTMVWHTDLIKDSKTLQLVDKTLAEDAARFGPLSVNKTAQAIEAIVDQYDPGALRRTRATARSRDVVIDSANQQGGTTAMWGRLYATDAAVLDRRLMQMAHAVCDDDRRTIAQRRADALGALAAGADHLACGCGNAHCPAAHQKNERASGVAIHVVADQSAVSAEPDQHLSGERASRPIMPDEPLVRPPDPEPDVPTVNAPAAVLTSGGVIPPALLAELIRNGAKLQPVHHPGELSKPEAGYRPSAALERFVRCRDMTCRFPNCDRPAEFCDVDHTVPYHAGGSTHPSNLKCLCRKHHLLKTFWTAWRDRQLPDGTVVWTSPTGQTYTTHPGSRLLFPTLCLPTGELPAAPTVQLLAHRGLMMPVRRRTREQDRARRIDAERALNDAHIAERNQPPPF
ncbi:HNH endonuclease signature motif containing protein [Mycobacterium noviomagense]|uniref:HNH nuclease domain-containing protein n=1 Tax=Mycobacterium noviomagense TaxID=459858 RepID=A0A7I7PK00_9MYCO|nr:HNH endonuclease signature motif containing protein [Mycobacterium noviomagense]ORB16335.1 hypothetical protein BST37_07275 [Mycobacterium noviomagense]BBY08852.1 hypothetical protein MNVI_41700 [Mycobacterium noviomagense]